MSSDLHWQPVDAPSAQVSTDSDDDHDESLEQSVYEYESTLDPLDPRVVDVLTHGEVTVLGQMPWSSNVVLLTNVSLADELVPAVYKPGRGERPLWDFPPELWKREVAFYQLGKLMGVDVVPPTVARDDAPYGSGSLQTFIPADHSEHYFTLIEDERHNEPLQQICVLDLIANSTDRKGGHCLIDDQDRIWAIDNALSFHEDPKLRTVIWEFGGQPLTDDTVSRLHELIAVDLHPHFDGLLSGIEIATIIDRAAALIDHGHFPTDPTKRRYPWPLI